MYPRERAERRYRHEHIQAPDGRTGEAEEWEETLNSMLNEGAPLSDADYPLVLQYLSKNFAH